MKYAKIVVGVVDYISFEPAEGLVEVGDDVYGGMIDNGDGTFSAPEKTPEQIERELNNSRWEALTKYMEDNPIETTLLNTFNVNKEGLIAISIKVNSISEAIEIDWNDYNVWFKTNRVELLEVLEKAEVQFSEQRNIIWS